VQWVADGRPAHLRDACEQSLKRLKLQRIDLYQLHRLDPKVPLEDSIGELARLRQEGKIRHVGVSNFKVEELARARRIVPIASVQNRYNVADRTSEDVLTVCAHEGIAFIPWAPIARGSADNLEKHDRGKGLQAVAQARGVSVLQVAIAWLLAKSPAMVPIPGTSSVQHLEEDIAAARLRLSPAEMAAIG
jgi:aryl-alcohol dehydrogenase-like predicted oxidoreductase